MKPRFLATALAMLLLVSGQALASEPDLCLACHGGKLGGGQVTLGSLAWTGPVEGETLSPCPGVVRAKQELFITESRLVRLAAALAELEEGGVRLAALSAELHRLSDQYHNLLRQPVVSLSSLSAGLGKLRRELDLKVQQPLWQLRAERSRLLWLGGLLIMFLGLLLAGLIGWRRRLSGPPEPLPLRLAREGRLDGLLRKNGVGPDDETEGGQS
jgi:hypothetical protein